MLLTIAGLLHSKQAESPCSRMTKDTFPDCMGEDQSSYFLSTCCLFSQQPYSLGILSLICQKENLTLNLSQDHRGCWPVPGVCV